MSETVKYLDNFGQDADVVRPQDTSWRVKEKPDPVEVALLVDDTRHWLIAWETQDNDYENPEMRVVQIVREIGKDHLTNWGPYTKSIERQVLVQAHWFFLATLTLEKRKELEAIAKDHPVQVPDGVYDCRTWIDQVVQEAVKNGIFEPHHASAALEGAYAVPPLA